ncbi:hypothetical protein O7632_22160 [Solwaraspora sp. WMMD406]|uniref:hypothetical protein n=1 Tax=Solwaraspora sp. WMMD406 TaxID=3016095 RepID=UPI0024172A65|nr:hypothetical protein [Solwaraspora sp. WMMD406]MDG4766782.1 hypothetical protein [Solwaraspora sp. WMMD406]
MGKDQGSSGFRRHGKRAVQAGVLALLAAGAFSLTATGPAVAGGTSGSVFNCYTQWWNTAWAQKCGAPGAKYTGTYVSGIGCSAQSGKRIDVVRVQGSRGTVSGPDCTFSANNGWISYY